MGTKSGYPPFELEVLGVGAAELGKYFVPGAERSGQMPGHGGASIPIQTFLLGANNLYHSVFFWAGRCTQVAMPPYSSTCLRANPLPHLPCLVDRGDFGGCGPHLQKSTHFHAPLSHLAERQPPVTCASPSGWASPALFRPVSLLTMFLYRFESLKFRACALTRSPSCVFFRYILDRNPGRLIVCAEIRV